MYLIDKMDHACDYYYKNDNKNLWKFYIYYNVSLIVSIVLIVIGFIYNCSKKKK